MGQSVTIACAPTWDLASLTQYVAAAALEAGATFTDYGHQLEVWSQDRYLMLIAYEVTDTRHQAFGIQDYATNELLDARFRQEVHGLRFLEIDFHDIDLTRRVLRAISEAAVSRGETAWIDTDYGWVIHVRDFLEETDADPRWDWRHDASHDD